MHFFATCKVQIGFKFLGSPGKVWKNFSYQFLITKFSRLQFFRTTKDEIPSGFKNISFS